MTPYRPDRLCRILILGTLVVQGIGCAPPNNPWITLTDARYQVGDDSRWAQPEWDDAAWPQVPVLALPDTTGVIWVRLNVPELAFEKPGLAVAGVVAREVYWDGVRIGRAGRVGTDRAREQAGPIDATFRIPDTLATPGPHLIAARVSSFRRPPRTSGLLMQFIVGDFAALTVAPFHSVGVPLLFLGGFVLVALYYSMLYIADRRRLPYLLTAALCLAVAALLIAESWRNAIGYTYDLHAIRVGIIEGLTATVGLLLSATFSVQFGLPRRRLVLGLLAATIILSFWLIEDHETGTHAVFTAALTVALGITGWAAWHQRLGAWWALGGVALCFGALLVTAHDFMDRAFFPAFGVLVAGLLTSLGLQTRAERRNHAVALATAARLEAELLKKHLQPHFLMNTLTSVLEWFETDPARGAQTIEALAAELQALTAVSGERLIPMAHELALCRAHLEVMGYRRAVAFALDAEGVDPEGTVPPAVIHTLIENAVTHNAYPPGHVTFTLRETQTGGHRQLILRSPLAQPRRKPRPEGGGLRYVRARLEEAVPGQWALHSGAENGAWVTRISMPAGGQV